MSVLVILQGGPRTMGQGGGMPAAGGPGSNGDKAGNVRSHLSLFYFTFAYCRQLCACWLSCYKSEALIPVRKSLHSYCRQSMASCGQPFA